MFDTMFDTMIDTMFDTMFDTMIDNETIHDVHDREGGETRGEI